MKRLLGAIWAAALVACTPDADISGTWNVCLDPSGTMTADSLLSEHVDSLFKTTITLPGTTDLAGLGHEPGRTDETSHLTRRHAYVGKAWYRKKVVAPAVWKDRELLLYLERTKASALYLDGHLLDSCNDVSTPQTYYLGKLRPGVHTLTLCVDNAGGGGNVDVCVEVDTGEIRHAIQFDGWHNVKDIDSHPDSGAQLNGVLLENWESVKAEVIRFQQAFPYCKVAGWDIALTDEGPVVIEINDFWDRTGQLFIRKGWRNEIRECYLAWKKTGKDYSVGPQRLPLGACGGGSGHGLRGPGLRKAAQARLLRPLRAAAAAHLSEHHFYQAALRAGYPGRPAGGSPRLGPGFLPLDPPPPGCLVSNF